MWTFLSRKKFQPLLLLQIKVEGNKRNYLLAKEIIKLKKPTENGEIKPKFFFL